MSPLPTHVYTETDLCIGTPADLDFRQESVLLKGTRFESQLKTGILTGLSDIVVTLLLTVL